MLPLPTKHIRPEASLSHPLFLGALLVLALNDHVLKGAGLLPAALTGKLSDVAGLLVAPLVLAWVLRIERRRGWLAVHAAVGVGFALLQWVPAALALEDGLRALGVGARSWADPTDLLALPALALSHRWLGAPRPRATTFAPLVGLGALIVCTATNAPGGGAPPRYPFPTAGILETDTFIRHMGSEDLQLALRRIRDEESIDCDTWIDGPAEDFGDDHFTDEQEWLLARGDALPLWDRLGGAVDRDCYAVRLKVRDHEWLLSWRRGTPPTRDVDIRLDADEQIDAVAIEISGDPETAPRVPPGLRVRLRP